MEDEIQGAAQVDPYLDRTVLMRYGDMVSPDVNIRMLATKMPKWSDGLKIAADAWTAQNKGSRPLEYRHTDKDNLHDRLVLLDGGREGWNIGQSIKDIANKSPTAFIKLPPEVLAGKVAFYEKCWNAAPVAS